MDVLAVYLEMPLIVMNKYRIRLRIISAVKSEITIFTPRQCKNRIKQIRIRLMENSRIKAAKKS